MLNNKKISWTLVADGSRARIFASDLNKHNLRLITDLNSETARVHSHDLGSEKPHGVSERNTRESRVDLHAKEEERFSKHLAELLNKGCQEHEYQNLILIAAPKILGHLRNMVNKQTSQLISKEVNKDLTHINEEELKSYIWD